MGGASGGAPLDHSTKCGPLSISVCKSLTASGTPSVLITTPRNHINNIMSAATSTVSVPPGKGPGVSGRLATLDIVLKETAGSRGGAPNAPGNAVLTAILSATGHSASESYLPNVVSAPAGRLVSTVTARHSPAAGDTKCTEP